MTRGVPQDFRVQANLNEQEYDALDAIAKHEGVSMSYVLRKLLRDEVNRRRRGEQMSFEEVGQ